MSSRIAGSHREKVFHYYETELADSLGDSGVFGVSGLGFAVPPFGG